MSPYSKTLKLTPVFPSVAVKDETGEWKTVIDMIGLPAGKNKTITVDLTGKFSIRRPIRSD